MNKNDDKDSNNTTKISERGIVAAILRSDEKVYQLFEGENIIGSSIHKDLDIVIDHISVSDVSVCTIKSLLPFYVSFFTVGIPS